MFARALGGIGKGGLSECPKRGSSETKLTGGRVSLGGESCGKEKKE